MPPVGPSRSFLWSPAVSLFLLFLLLLSDTPKTSAASSEAAATATRLAAVLSGSFSSAAETSTARSLTHGAVPRKLILQRNLRQDVPGKTEGSEEMQDYMVAPDEAVQAAAGNETLPPTGNETLPPYGYLNLAAPGNETQPPAGNETLPTAGKNMQPPAGNEALPTTNIKPLSPETESLPTGELPLLTNGNKKPLSGGGKAKPPAENETLPTGGENIQPPAGNETLPPTGNGFLPIAGNETQLNGALPPGNASVPPALNTSQPFACGGNSSAPCECVCAFNFDNTLRVARWNDTDAEPEEGRAVIETCKALGCGIAISCATEDREKIVTTLQQLYGDTFTDEFFESDAFQYGEADRTAGLQRIYNYFRPPAPSCIMLFDDQRDNQQYADEAGVIFEKVPEYDGARLEDLGYAVKSVDNGTCYKQWAAGGGNETTQGPVSFPPFNQTLLAEFLQLMQIKASNETSAPAGEEVPPSGSKGTPPAKEPTEPGPSSSPPACGGDSGKDCNCVCAFDFDNTLRVIRGKDQDAEPEEAREVLDKCKALGCGIAISSANDNKDKMVMVLQRYYAEVFNDQFFNSDAFQWGADDKTDGLRRIDAYFRPPAPSCILFFDDLEDNKRYADEVGVIFEKAYPGTGVRLKDLDYATAKLDDKTCHPAKGDGGDGSKGGSSGDGGGGDGSKGGEGRNGSSNDSGGDKGSNGGGGDKGSNGGGDGGKGGEGSSNGGGGDSGGSGDGGASGSEGSSSDSNGGGGSGGDGGGDGGRRLQQMNPPESNEAAGSGDALEGETSQAPAEGGETFQPLNLNQTLTNQSHNLILIQTLPQLMNQTFNQTQNQTVEQQFNLKVNPMFNDALDQQINQTLNQTLNQTSDETLNQTDYEANAAEPEGSTAAVPAPEPAEAGVSEGEGTSEVPAPEPAEAGAQEGESTPASSEPKPAEAGDSAPSSDVEAPKNSNANA